MSEITLDDIRAAVREELAALMPRARARMTKERRQLDAGLLTIRECARRYRRGYDTIARMAKSGELMAVPRPHGDTIHLMVVAADADRKLGGAA